tara:strand:- start:1572 stop:1859 length:288 start_codon:yes stop_codon:yes gene_type:complete
MTYNITNQDIETWNKENPDEEPITLKQCVEHLDEQVEEALESLKETIYDKLDWYRNQYNWEVGSGHPNESFFDYRGEFNDLVIDKFWETFNKDKD